MREADTRIENSEGSHVRDAIASFALANTRGFRGVTQGTSVSRTAAPIARDGTSKRLGSYGTAARGWSTAESTPAVAQHAVHRALALIGARKPPTTRVPVIFERDVAAAVLADVFAAASAANVVLGNSWLAGRIGERIGSALATRALLDMLRQSGSFGGGPAPFAKPDRSRFLAKLDELIHAVRRGKRK